MRFFERLRLKREQERARARKVEILNNAIQKFRAEAAYDETEDIRAADFPQQFKDSGQEIIYQQTTYAAGNTGGQEDRYTWFIKVVNGKRVCVRTILSVSDDYQKNIIYPSYIYQLIQLKSVMEEEGIPLYDEEQSTRIMYQMGFKISDYPSNINRIRILSPEECQEYQGKSVTF